MIAGGASGIVGMAGELGGDDRLVAFMQYLRVLVVVLLTPLLVARLAAAGGGAVRRAKPCWPPRADWLLTAADRARRRVGRPSGRVPAGHADGTDGRSRAGSRSPASDFVVPPVVRELAFALIGLQVGLRFTIAP